jgi:hypothetical protein
MFLNAINSSESNLNIDSRKHRFLVFMVLWICSLALAIKSFEIPALADEKKIEQNYNQPKIPNLDKALKQEVFPKNSADSLLGDGTIPLKIQGAVNQPLPSGIIPAGSGIVAKTLMQIVTDPARKYAVPITMITILPIFDTNGNPIIPASTLLTGRIEKREGGDEIIIESLLYKGRVINLETIGRLIPAQIRPENFGQFVTPPKSKASAVLDSVRDSSFSGILISIALSNVSDSGRQTVNPLLLGALGADLVFRGLAALTEKSPKPLPPIVDIPQDSILVFALRKDLTLPEIPAENTLLIKTDGIQ